MLFSQRVTLYSCAVCLFLLVIWHLKSVQRTGSSFITPNGAVVYDGDSDGAPKVSSFWANRHVRYPAASYEALPQPFSTPLPRVQHIFEPESERDALVRVQRQAEVKTALQRCWSSYREYAWMRDELTPITGSGRDTFGGWAATLVDTLDLLWIAGLKDEFHEAVDAAMKIDFSNTSEGQINVFETTIRYLGGFLAAYDLSNDRRLLDKTLELAEMLYAAFDTPNRMPITRWDFHAAAAGVAQEADGFVLVAEIGSLTVEFTRLAQITKDPKWYDAVARIVNTFDDQRLQSNLPGMWPLVVNAYSQDFHTGDAFTLGAMSDSLYEYLPKMYALLGGSEQYARMYKGAMDAAIEHALFRPMLPDEADVLMAGPVTAERLGSATLNPEGQHLVCFAGGMLALGGKLFNNETHVALGRKLADGCVWAYEHSELGIMPETFSVVACSDRVSCRWDHALWQAETLLRHGSQDLSGEAADAFIASQRLPQGFTSINDRRYILRPEAIESVFILYRITGDPALMEQAWRMFLAIRRHTETQYANAAISDVTDPTAPKIDSMESFWTVETLKYFYLIFSEPNVISLDDFVFNTEAHPMLRPA